MTYHLHPDAEVDLREAAEFYRDRAGNELALTFIEDFEHSVGLLLDHPTLGALWRNGWRRLIMKRFPYSLIYKLVGQQITFSRWPIKAADLGTGRIAVSLKISPKKKTKAALRGIKVVPTSSYAQGEERPYGNTVYTRTDGISATGTARGGGAI